jgi:hypothetical protein
MSQRTEDHEVIVKTTGLCLGYGQRVVLVQVVERYGQCSSSRLS